MMTFEEWKESEEGFFFRQSWNLLQASLRPNMEQFKKDEKAHYEHYVREYKWDQKYKGTK